MIGAQLDSIGRGAEGSESGEESGSMESRVLQSTGLVFGSTAVGISAPEAASNRLSSIGAAGSELGVGADCASWGRTAGRCPRSRNLYSDRAEHQPSPLRGL